MEQHLRSPEHKFVLKDALVEVLVDVKMSLLVCTGDSGRTFLELRGREARVFLYMRWEIHVSGSYIYNLRIKLPLQHYTFHWNEC